MDILSPFTLHPAFINTLPPFFIFGLPLNTVVFFILLILIGLFLYKKQVINLRIALIALWLILSVLYTIQAGIQVYTENMIFSGKSLDELRSLTTAGNFYNFLKSVQDYVPDKNVLLFIPPDNPYFSQKTNYYLYPYITTEDARHILVFNNPKVKFNEKEGKLIINDGKEEKIIDVLMLKKFSETEYILMKK